MRRNGLTYITSWHHSLVSADGRFDRLSRGWTRILLPKKSGQTTFALQAHEIYEEANPGSAVRSTVDGRHDRPALVQYFQSLAGYVPTRPKPAAEALFIASGRLI